MDKIKKIVLFSANKTGGIVQLTEQLADTLMDVGIDCLCYFPEGTKVSRASLIVKFYSISPYENIYSRNVSAVAERIIEEDASYVWFTDSPLMSLLVLCKVCKSCKTILTIHDLKTHPTNNSKFLHLAYLNYSNHYRKIAYKMAKNILLLSPNSLSIFNSFYPEYCSKAILLHLGAHIPVDEIKKPEDIGDVDSYHLFFGVIDKYKGINNLLDSYNASNKDMPLVIAGKGTLTTDEKRKIDNSSGVYLINRFISNGEMKWLISHAKSVVLPYIEASQSGVLPISYYFGVPVIVSDLPGLSQYVEHEKTGYICKNNNEISNALNLISNSLNIDFKNNTLSYYNNFLEWHSNIENMINMLEETN
ncbi:MAG: glycosyltransferase family 4 protein [Clostridiales bacterium]|nr:glycosyltransferase family 4 protein [Clostridiales bacterium]